MKAITLTQPWATLVAYGEKRIETRSWTTRHRGELAIHAAKGLGPIGGMAGLVAVIEQDPFASVLRSHLSGYTVEERARDLPLGVIVAVTELVDVVPTEQVWHAMKNTLEFASAERIEQEAAFGDYTPGRWAWILNNRVNLYDGIPCRGSLGLWDVPPEVEADIWETDP